MANSIIKNERDQEPVFSLLGIFWSPQGAEVRFEQRGGVTLVLQEGMDRVGVDGDGYLPHLVGKIEPLMREILILLREERKAYGVLAPGETLDIATGVVAQTGKPNG